MLLKVQLRSTPWLHLWARTKHGLHFNKPLMLQLRLQRLHAEMHSAQLLLRLPLLSESGS
jgi:hypothetical protein